MQVSNEIFSEVNTFVISFRVLKENADQVRQCIHFTLFTNLFKQMQQDANDVSFLFDYIVSH